MINYLEIQDYLIQNSEKIVKILETLGFSHIVDRGSYIQFPNKDGDNNTACSILKATLQYNNYTRGKTGNLFTLVQDEKCIGFKESLEFISKIIGYKGAKLNPIKYPFHHFYKDIIHQNDSELSLNIYPFSSLPPPNNLSKKWFDDGVALTIQEKFGIRYDHDSDRIIIPELNYMGELVGAKARSNNPNCKMSERWSMYIPWSKSQTIYGWYENYQNIQKKKTCFIFESEKAVLQAASFNLNLGLAIGGHNISKTQEKYIKSLMCDKIIVCFDEGIEEEEIIYESKKLISNNRLVKNKVGYIYDKDGDILKRDSKDSPADVGKDNFYNLIKNNVKYIN